MGSKCSQSSVELQGPSSCYETALTDHYLVLRDIGEGSFAQVKLARHLRTGAEVAVKVVAKIEQKWVYLSERDMMVGLDHPHVIQLFQVIETTGNIYMVMEYAGRGQLRHLIPKEHGMEEEKVRRLFRQIVSAVGHCHERGVVHLDLKVDNMVLDAAGNVKLIDFGLSSRFSAGQKLKKFCGTVRYVAPEIVQRQEYEGPPADIWSLGVVLYNMLTGRFPFRGLTPNEVKLLILRGRYHIPKHVSKSARNLIQQILKFNPTQRPTAQQILGHPWLSRSGAPSPTHASKPLPKQPDPAIMSIMLNMGYNPYHTWVSLSNRMYDEAMATYLILRHQLTQGAECSFQVKRRRRRVRRGSGSLGPSSEPALPTFPLPCERKLPDEAKQAGQKDGGGASVPAIPLYCPHVRTPSPRTARQHCRASCKTVSPRHDSCEVISTSSDGTSTGQSIEDSSCWKGVTRRVATCIQKLCCCAPCFRRNRVAPMEGGHKVVRFENRVAPV